MTDTTPARRRLLALLLDRVDRDALLPAERPLLRALVAAEQAAADAWRLSLDARRQRVAAALTADHYRRAAEGIVASPEEHSLAAANVAIAALAGADTGACPTPETHNWGCGCPTDESAALPKPRHWRGTDGDDITEAYMDAQATLARVRRFARALSAEPHPAHDHVCPDDIRAGILSALRPPSPTPDDTPTTSDGTLNCGAAGPWGDDHRCNRPPEHDGTHESADGCQWPTVDQAIDVLAEDIARRAVEGNGTGQKLGILAGNQAPGIPVNVNDARRRAGCDPALTAITGELPDDLPWAGEHDDQCAALYTGDPTHAGDTPTYSPVNYPCDLITGHLPVLHAKRQGATVFRWTDDIAVYPLDDAPQEPQP